MVGSVTAGSWLTTAAGRGFRCTTALRVEGDTRATAVTVGRADELDTVDDCTAATCTVLLAAGRAGARPVLPLERAAAVTPPPTASTAAALAATVPIFRSICMARNGTPETPQSEAHVSPGEGPLSAVQTVLTDAATAVVGTAVLGGFGYIRAMRRDQKRDRAQMRQMVEDWTGEPARPGVPERPGVMVRLQVIETNQEQQGAQIREIWHEVHPNSGASMRDEVRRIHDATTSTPPAA